MRYILSLLIVTAVLGDDADKYLNDQKEALIKAVNTADDLLVKTIKTAKRDRDRKVRQGMLRYLTALKKVESHWVKQGNLDKALQTRAAILDMEKKLGIKRPDAPKMPRLNIQLRTDTEVVE
jgi:hypothetical protein